MDTQLKKGVLEMCILIRLSKEDLYGYEIMKIIQDVFPDVYDGSIYTILRRINGEGYTETYMKDVPSGGPPRKYYRITAAGKEYCGKVTAEWEKMTESVSQLLKK
jgi:PadR family transcriptional regulator PadR